MSNEHEISKKVSKLPNDAFTAVSDIDFDGFSLKNIPYPIDGKDAVNKAYVDDRTIQPAAPIKPIITVWAEDKGPLRVFLRQW